MEIRRPTPSPTLLVSRGDPRSEEVVRVLDALDVSVSVVEVPLADLKPHGVPRLITESGIYVGEESIERVAKHELLNGGNGSTAPSESH